MRYAVIIAGGCGRRTGQSVPKQFLTVNDIPIIVYTLLNLQKMEWIDKIVVVIPEGWENFLLTYTEQYNISKFEECIAGGETRHKSITNAIFHLKHTIAGDASITLIDANRPMIPNSVIEDSIKSLRKNIVCVAGEPCFDTMLISKGDYVERIADREVVFKGQTPETMWLSDAVEIYEKAKEDGIADLPTTSLFLKYGKQAKLTSGSAKSFKITTTDDIEIFRALISI